MKINKETTYPYKLVIEVENEEEHKILEDISTLTFIIPDNINADEKKVISFLSKLEKALIGIGHNTKKIIIKELTQTSEGCPSQWEGVTSEGTSVYIRLRHGYFSFDLDDQIIFYGNPLGYDGVMSTDEMKAYLIKNFKHINFDYENS